MSNLRLKMPEVFLMSSQASWTVYLLAGSMSCAAARYFFPRFLTSSSRGSDGARSASHAANLDDVDAHRAGGAGDDLRGLIDVVCVEIGQLRGRDLLQL